MFYFHAFNFKEMDDVWAYGLFNWRTFDKAVLNKYVDIFKA